MLPTMMVSRLLKSCAMPPVSWPIGLHLLGLPQGLLGLQALGNLVRDPLLQGLVQALELLGGLLGLLAGEEQLALVLAPVGGIEEGDAVDERPAGRVPLLDGVGQNRQGASVGAGQIERDLVHEALHLQERREMGVVEDPAADAQQVLEALVTDEVLPRPCRSRSRNVWLALMMVPSGRVER